MVPRREHKEVTSALLYCLTRRGPQMVMPFHHLPQ
ncbi:hypothetical protein DPX39_090020800 [Trypanosoma brucei equiperdum]|uniref:Uncharacterized protein n=1 Tax=Trypanosoma brucei equiperdum TaxID=630700 RepID=A0A3L6L4G8_9TRYP|nr:hypothetical protein DPX39_090020800 [Trypanosoma brucei equiperdum]